ncbi:MULTISPECIES: LysR family transcriptional regulator [unclassified Salinivibrio]|uniref:LysR family transcriptional regulator n=1 Tax=unclassified Salinivibrio TaxID=2636825 RepID=UPI0009868EAE|nr:MULTISPECIES: LysR family transcriptional regulator [unclassified Salinivibrio]OOF10702.1 LysR family transcriptional regulator [Salinivibrio sp. PR919]OOF14880.1 LysR family transcriptional regulator [Salinivibrio sp. PR932]
MAPHWEGLNEFLAVAEHGSFTQAAYKLDTNVVAVSRRVAALEAHLGVKLFHRTTRKVTLTDEGEHYYQRCRPLMAALQEAEQTITQSQALPTGLVRVTAPVNFGEQYIAPLLAPFLRQYPHVSVDLHLTNRRIDLIETGTDVAIRIGHLADSSLKAKRLGSRRLSICASPAYLAAHGRPQTPSELNRHVCLVGSNEHWHYQAGNKVRTLTVSGRLRCNSGVALLEAAKQGIGLAQLPHYYVQEALAEGTLEEVLVDYRIEEEGIWALYPRGRQLQPKVAALLTYLAQHLPTQPAPDF